MPDTIQFVLGASVVLLVPALGMALYHGTRLEKHLHRGAGDISSEKGKRQ